MLRGVGRSFALAFLVAGMGACVPPTAVGDYARTSGLVAARFPELAADISASCIRAQGYQALSEARDWWDDDALAARCQSLADATPALVTASRALSRYLSALGALADDRVIRYDAGLDALAASVRATDQFPRERVDAVNGLARLLARAATDGYRRSRLSATIGEAHPNVESITDALTIAVDRAYVLTLSNERAALDRFYVKAIQDGRATEPLTALLVLDHRDERLAELRRRRSSAEAYVAALRTVARGHRRLSESRDKLRAAELAAELAEYAASIESLLADIRKAF